MIERSFGWTGAGVPVIGQGTWAIDDRARAVEALRVGLDLGLTHVDTAEMYRGAEEIVADALQGRDREDAFIVSKVLPRNASYEGTLEACEKSLRRLETDHLDVYLLHWPGSEHPVGETMRAMETLVAEGKTRFMGVSNFDVDDLQAAEEALSRERIACNQVLYHLGDRSVENRVLPYCREREIAVVAYSPFGSGGFPPGGRRGRDALERVAERHGKTPHQVALNFLTRDESVFAIPKAEHVEHVEENAASVGWSLTREDVAELEAAFPVPTPGPLRVL